MRKPQPFRRSLGRGLEMLEPRLALAAVPPGFADLPLVSGLNNPTAMAIAPDGRIFVTQQGGDLRVVKNGSLLDTPFLQLPVDSEGERGLLGVAFDPNFASNKYIYVYYTTASSPVHNRVSRFTANGDVVAPGSETVLLDLNNLTVARNHNGGALHFGEDGKLYVAVGENAVPENSQKLSNLLGKILRINPTPGDIIPDDNPFVNTPGARGEIWALGFRNPFTFSVQPGTGRIFVNDVGEKAWEEINALQKGGNYGWPAEEGPGSDPDFISPIFAYQQSVGRPRGRAITGGAFYNPANNQFPAWMTSDYFFADFGAGFIWRYDIATDSAYEFATGAGRPVDLKVRPNGDLLYLDRVSGSIKNIRYVNDAPAVSIGGNLSYTENQSILIAAGATVADSDSPQLGNGRLTVRTTDNATPADRFGIRTADGISRSGNQVRFAGTTIGTVSGGFGSPLVVALNNNATPARVQALLRNVTFAVASNNPSAQTRTIRVQLSDGDYGLSAPGTKQISITKVNDAPRIGGVSGTIGYTQNGPHIALASGATVADADSRNLAGGKLTIQIASGGSAANRLFIGGPFVNTGSALLLNGQQLGTRNSGGGQGFVKLEFTLNSRATPALVQQMLRSLRFRTANNDKLGVRQINITLSDGDGATSGTVVRSVNVTA